VHKLLKIASCIFLLFLAWKFGTTPPKSFDKEKKRSPLTFLQACSFQWVNPKAWIFAIGAIAAFSADNNFFTRIFIISLVLLITMIISTYAWLAGGCYLEKILKTARQQKIFNVSMGIILMVTVFTIIL
jgi:threonine/homoserine/homoserine lactone efflux protein